MVFTQHLDQQVATMSFLRIFAFIYKSGGSNVPNKVAATCPEIKQEWLRCLDAGSIGLRAAV